MLPGRDRRRRRRAWWPTACRSTATWSSTTACAPPARSGCPTRWSAATCGCPVRGCPGRSASERGIALLADGMEVGGDLEGRDTGRGAFSCAGQVRLVDAHVRGTREPVGIELAAPDGYALLADRLHIGGELYLRRVRCAGHDAAAERWRSARRWTAPAPRWTGPGCGPTARCARRSTCGPPRSARTCCASRGSPPPAACGRAWPRCASRSSSSTPRSAPRAAPATRSTPTASRPSTSSCARPSRPAGAVRLAAARVGTFADSRGAVGGRGRGHDRRVRLPDDRRHPDQLTSATRLRLLEQVMGDYAPGPYEQLAAAYRRAGRRGAGRAGAHGAPDPALPEAGPAGRMWGALQRWTVGFGYQPWLAVCWLVLAWLLGGAWFVGHVPIAGRRRPAPRLRRLDLRRGHAAPDREPRAGRVLAFGRAHRSGSPAD